MNDARHESPSTDTLEYVGFWLRVFAALVDTVVVSATVAVEVPQALEAFNV